MNFKQLNELIGGFGEQYDLESLTVIDSTGREIDFVGVENGYLIIGNEKTVMKSKGLGKKIKGGKMQDRFRFRVWWQPNYEKPKMLYGAEQTYDFLRGTPEAISAESFGEVLEDKNFIVMQCTGLKDKNGKLIYEADIVKDKFGSLYKVEYENVITGFYPFNNYDISINGYFDEDIEVIGNIYENSELLATKNPSKIN